MFDFLSVLRGQSVFLNPATTANDLRLWRIYIPDLIQYIIFLILILEKESVFSLFKVFNAMFWHLLQSVALDGTLFQKSGVISGGAR